VADRHDEIGISVGRGLDGSRRTDDSAGTGPIVGDDGMAPPPGLRELLTGETCEDIGRTARRERNDDARCSLRKSRDVLCLAAHRCDETRSHEDA
jgi:hypothetical protein